MRINALAIRILRQFIRDKRTLAMLVMAPILILTMLYLVFDNEEYIPKIGIVNTSELQEDTIHTMGANISNYADEVRAHHDVEHGHLDAYIIFTDVNLSIFLEGSDPLVTNETMNWIKTTFEASQPNNHMEIDVHYVHGTGDMGQFDYFGPVLLGFFVFFFVFIVAGISFIRERSTGTLDRLLSTPIRKWEIVFGYVLGFGLLSMVQSILITTFAIYVLDMMLEGSFIYVLFIILTLALTALTLGVLISSFANSEFQMMQFIPVIVIPQIFFSGLFHLETISEYLSWIGPLTPLYYAADALRDVMVRGLGWGHIYLNLLIMLGFSIVFMFFNILVLKRYRAM